MNNFADMNTVYEQRKNRLVTWISPDGRKKNQIDYILVPIDQKGIIKKCRVFNPADINSDYSLLMAKYTIFLPKVKHYKRKLKRFDTSKSKIDPICNTFKIQLSGKFESLINDISNQNVEDCFNKFIDGVNEITKNLIGYRRNKAINALSEETKVLCEKRRSFRKKVINSKKSHAATIQKYRKVNRIVKKEVKKAKRIQLDEKMRKLEDDFRKNDSHNFFKLLGELEGKPRKSLTVIKNQNADKRTQTDEVLKIWKENFEQHLNTKFPHDESILQSIPETMPGTIQSTEELIISKEENGKAISLLKNNKAPGSDLITVEVLKADASLDIS